VYLILLPEDTVSELTTLALDSNVARNVNVRIALLQTSVEEKRMRKMAFKVLSACFSSPLDNSILTTLL